MHMQIRYFCMMQFIVFRWLILIKFFMTFIIVIMSIPPHGTELVSYLIQ